MTPQIKQKLTQLDTLETQRRQTGSLTARSMIDREIRTVRQELDGLRRERLAELEARKKPQTGLINN